MTRRMLPPAAVGNQTKSINGRNYAAKPGVALDVMDADALMLEANGWTFVCLSGPTSGRSSGNLGLNAAAPGVKYYDTDIGQIITYDGQAWRTADGLPAHSFTAGTTTRLFPALSGGPFVVNGNTYAQTPGSVVDVPAADVAGLVAAGWTSVNKSGATGIRPASPVQGQKFVDTTLGVTIAWDGATWRNILTGASA